MPATATPTEIQDLDWLIGELESLMPLIDVVPFDEKPGDLPSITELIQDWYEDCLLRHSPALGLGVHPFHRPDGLTATITASIELRKNWMRHFDGMSMNEELRMSLRQVIRKERSLFRMIAERIMTIQKPVP